MSPTSHPREPSPPGGRTHPARWERLGRGVAGAAVLIGLVTILARAAGFGRYLVFARTVETGCLSTAYFTANQVPNIVFEVVAGGALAGAVVPVLASAASRSPGEADARTEVDRVTSALLTWVLLLLVPFTLLVIVFASPIASFLVGSPPGCDPAATVEVTARMLVVFAPQIPLYGLAVVLYGVLQAHRRFAGPALAPLVSSLVVMAAYVVFVPLSGGVDDPAGVPRPAELALSVGTTLGVAALVLTVLPATAGLRPRIRPALAFPPGVGTRVRRLALAGLAALLAQQVSTVVVVRLANAEGGAGALTAYNYAWAIFMVPYAVLAVPIATSAFPVLSARASAGEEDGFATLTASATRAVVLVSAAAAGILAAVSAPVARVFLDGTHSQVDPGNFAAAVALFAPGLVGYGLVTHLGRVLYARGRGRTAAVGTVAGWCAVIAVQTALTLTLPREWTVGGLALGMTAGMTVGGGLLLVSVARACGRPALAGLARAGLAAVLGGSAAFGTGYAVAGLFAGAGPVTSVFAAAGAALVSGAAFVAVAYLVDPRDLRALLRRFAGGTR
ncbi:murein biosynthesis integral membrane protein MurJ [Rhizohabitans arisaemae]|uniref:murein biosynthesis integral membrane protein MurJ n=1 Tax=Rhizohabitans arisaemae TaxID=2720610 RepID=UPI0024B15278|nr:lipid II flippase MurJ [Rhizohabitans arisaemae]